MATGIRNTALSDIRESMEMYDQSFSEQIEIGAEEGSPALPISPFSNADRARALDVALKHAEAVIGARGGPGRQMRARHILEHAREHNLDARLYELVWFVDRTTGPEHVIIDNGANLANAGESA
jgi:hypothetical protein